MGAQVHYRLVCSDLSTGQSLGMKQFGTSTELRDLLQRVVLGERDLPLEELSNALDREDGYYPLGEFLLAEDQMRGLGLARPAAA